MKRFYGEIEKIECEYLLKATPYSKESRINFWGNLDKETFFKYLYSERSRAAEVSAENDLFDNGVCNALRDLDNEFAKVSVLHIAGYGGCGKTTYIHHLLWSLREKIGRYEVIDYEGSERAVDPFIERTQHLIESYGKLEDVCDFFSAITDEKLLVTKRFHEKLPHLCRLGKKMRAHAEKQSVPTHALYNLIDSFGDDFVNEKDFLEFLFFVDFLLLIYDRFLKKRNGPMVLVIDNCDSMKNSTTSTLPEESVLLSSLRNFANDCNYFFVSNMSNDMVYANKRVKEVCEATKLQIIFTTRVVTERRYEILEPDWEKIKGWLSLPLPQNYYDHEANIIKRVDYYLSCEEGASNQIVDELRQIKNLARIVYHNYNFKRLFNGSYRVCIERICSIIKEYSPDVVQESINIFSRMRENPDAAEGAVGYFLCLTLNTFKRKGIYHEKLHLSPCQKDGTISLSRIILTILREKGGRCSLFDMFSLLVPLGYQAREVADEVWDLCETSREIWRRLLLFEIKIPRTVHDLEEQADFFDAGIRIVEDYSELVMCTAGNAYIEFVVPHFEFMHSRHEMGAKVGEIRYLPLFADSSEELIVNQGQVMYRFETKIDRVFKDVSDCCSNSILFAQKAMAAFEMDRDEYVNNSVFNYHTLVWDGGNGPKQSYESRLIFRHIGYIEKYRTYLLKKHEKDGDEFLRDINRRLIERIIRYIRLYQDSDKCFQTRSQDEAAKTLRKIAEKIRYSAYRDYVSRIETK